VVLEPYVPGVDFRRFFKNGRPAGDHRNASVVFVSVDSVEPGQCYTTLRPNGNSRELPILMVALSPRDYAASTGGPSASQKVTSSDTAPAPKAAVPSSGSRGGHRQVRGGPKHGRR
jgi:hypothetical protein